MAGGFFRGVVVGIFIAGGGYYLAGRAGLTGSTPDYNYTPPAESTVADSSTPLPAPPPEIPAPVLLEFPEIELPPIDAPIDLGLPAAPPAAEEVTLVPEAVTPGMLYDYTGGEALAPLSIVTSPGRDYYVKLVYAGTNDAAIGIYVLGGVTSEVQIPLGSYEMRYASGTTWYGYYSLFGPDTVYAKAVGTFDFRDEGDGYTGYTVELIVQEGGNLDTVGIGPEQF